jgi:hypothetical protein
MSALAAMPRCSGLESTIATELAATKNYLAWIDVHPLGAKVEGLFTAVNRLVDSLEVLAVDCDARHHGLVLDCVSDANAELREVLQRLNEASERERELKKKLAELRATERQVGEQATGGKVARP